MNKATEKMIATEERLRMINTKQPVKWNTSEAINKYEEFISN